MTGAIEFLRKRNAICKSFKRCNGDCPLDDFCSNESNVDESDLVRKVMEYEVEEVFNRR